jgi:hypothetical protein
MRTLAGKRWTGRKVVEPLSIVIVLIGVLIIATRGPLIFAPNRTLKFYTKLLSTNKRVRAMAVLFAPLGVAVIAVFDGEREMDKVVRLIGWIWVAATLWLLAAPDSYRHYADRFLHFIETSVDEAILRMIGVAAVAIGISLIHFGIYVH